MTDTTNAFNNLKYAIIKDGVVVNTVLFSNHDEEILQFLLDKHSADSYHNVTNNEIAVSVTSHYINGKFTHPKPVGNFWVWNENLITWEISVPRPSENHFWNNQTEEWIFFDPEQ